MDKSSREQTSRTLLTVCRFCHVIICGLRFLPCTGGTICAERTAIVKAVVCRPFHVFCILSYRASPQSEGTKSFLALAVVTYVSFYFCVYLFNKLALKYGRDVASALSPCGMCRQVIREFCAQTMPILLVPSDYTERITRGESGGILETSIAELLPHSFGPEHLELPREGPK